MVMMAFVLVILVVMMVMMAFAVRIVAFLAVAVMMLLLQRLHRRLQRIALFDRGEQVAARKAVPRGGDDGRFRVQLAHHGEDLVQALLAHVLRTAQHDAVRRFNLVHVKLAEVLAVDARLLGVDDRDAAFDHDVVGEHAADRALDVGELAHAGRLDQDAVGMELLQHFFERFREIADERAADAARVHLGDLDARFLQKRAVDADLAELVLDQNELFADVRLGDELLDERRFARAQKAAEDFDLCHTVILLSFGERPRLILRLISYHTLRNLQEP